MQKQQSTTILDMLLGQNYEAKILFIIAVLIILFLVLRQLMLWYWGTQRVISLLEQIEENTRPKDPLI